MVREMAGEDKFREKIAKILDSYFIVTDKCKILDELMDVVDDARNDGWEDGHDPKSFRE